jgi:dihydrofolate synthase/folylpolyglutamate synthase
MHKENKLPGSRRKISSNAYDDCLKAMYGLRRFGIKLGLTTIKKVLNGLGNPHKRFQCIHVAGTNGKGSIASSLSSILHKAGYRVGLYTSPHLVRFNERICIDNLPVPDENVVDSFEAVKAVKGGVRELTFFEYATAMAFNEFAQHNVDWAIIETGMGGRLDATNIINPSLSIISNISLEHRMYLGNTIQEIATEKGGIIKRNRPVVTGVKQKNAIRVVEEIARKKSSPLYRIGREFKVRKDRSGSFTYFGIENVCRKMTTSLLGNYQVENAALSIAACEVLNQKHTNLSIQSIREGLSKNCWPGRLEIVSTAPLILLDGAHNLIAARNLARFLSQNLSKRKITLVIGILDDKPYTAILRSLVQVSDRVILTRSRIDRALEPETLYPLAKKIVPDTQIIPQVGSAIQCAIDNAAPEDVICIAGSLYVVGEAKEHFGAGPVFFS